MSLSYTSKKLRIIKKINRLEFLLNTLLNTPNTNLYEISQIELEIDYLYSLLDNTVD